MFGHIQTPHGQEGAALPKLRGRVLVVEDNPTNQKVIVLRLEKLGCRADVAQNGREAVDAVAVVAYDVILMDCQMPVMDGFEATAHIRRRGGRRVPIIALTANAMEEDRERCLQAGMDDYLSKPVRNQELSEKLSHWILASQAEEEQEDSARSLHRFLASMEQEGIGREDIDAVLGGFLGSSQKLVADVESAVMAHDGHGLRTAAHTLKGSSATVGLTSLAALAAELEKHEKAADWDGAARSLVLVRREYAAARQLVSAVMAAHTT
jgi:CheY-like chemotaxis protein